MIRRSMLPPKASLLVWPTFAAIVAGFGVFALHPDPDIRRMGLAIGVISLAWLVIRLDQRRAREFDKLRDEQWGKIATVAIETVGLELLDIDDRLQPVNIDEEWHRLWRGQG